jgi:DivIVA domain-containing protein
MALVVVVLLGIAALTGIAVLLGMSESPLSSEPVDRPDDGLPDRPLTSHDVGGLRFRVGLRGYRMDDVDQALDRLRDALREAEERSVVPEQTLETLAAAPAKRTRSRKAAAPSEPGGA